MGAHLRAVWTFRHFWLSLVRMDLQQRYRRSVLGVGWSLLHPLAMTAVFCLVFSNLLGVGGGQTWQAYACYLIAGMTVWDFVRNAALQGCQAFLLSETYIRQCPLPCGIYPLRTVAGLAFHFVVGLGVVVGMAAALRPEVATARVAWAVLPAVVLTGVFAWAVATLAAFATVYFHDTRHLAEVGAQLLFFLTPIMYPRKVLDDKGLGWVVDLNPVCPFLDLVRDPLVAGRLPPLSTYAVAAGVTAAAVGLAVGTIGWLQKKLIFQL